jgi:uncharacterized membrane protein (DUF485 family)
MVKEKSQDWAGIAAQSAFKELLKSKARFVMPATLFFIVYYFALPVSVGYFPEFMGKQVWGPLNLAYLFALSQFFMAWIIAALYVRAAAGFDKQAAALVGHLEGGRAKKRPAKKSATKKRGAKS